MVFDETVANTAECVIIGAAIDEMQNAALRKENAKSATVEEAAWG